MQIFNLLMWYQCKWFLSNEHFVNVFCHRVSSRSLRCAEVQHYLDLMQSPFPPGPPRTNPDRGSLRGSMASPRGVVRMSK